MYIDRDEHRAKGAPSNIWATPPITRAQVQYALEAAFRGRAGFDTRGIWIQTDGAEVALGGLVHSGAEFLAAQRAAWSIPRVTQVRNNICVYH